VPALRQAVGSGVGLGVAVGLGDAVGDVVGEGDAVGDAVGVGVAVGVAVAVGEAVAVGDTVAVGEGVHSGHGVAVGVAGQTPPVSLWVPSLSADSVRNMSVVPVPLKVTTLVPGGLGLSSSRSKSMALVCERPQERAALVVVVSVVGAAAVPLAFVIVGRGVLLGRSRNQRPLTRPEVAPTARR